MAGAPGKSKSGKKDRGEFKRGWRQSLKDALNDALERRGMRRKEGEAWRSESAAHFKKA